MSTPISDMIEDTFESLNLSEKDVKSYEYMCFQTSQQNQTTLVNYDLEARLSGSDLFMRLKDAFILVKMSVTKIDGTFPANNTVAGLTHGAWSLFLNLVINISGSRVDYNQNPGQTFNIMAKSSKSADWVVDNGPEYCYWPAGFDNNMSSVIQSAQDATDDNFLAGKFGGANNTRWVKLKLCDVLGVCNIQKLLPGCNITLSMDKNQVYNEILMRTVGGDNVDLITSIQQLKLYIPCARLKERLANKINLAVLEKKPIPLDFQRIGYFRTNTTNGSAIVSNIFTSSKRPRYILTGPQLTGQITAQLNKNGGLYIVNNMTEAYISVNGQQYPFVKYLGNGESYLRELEAIKTFYGKQESNESSSIIRSNNYANFHAILPFDMSRSDNLFEENNNADVIVQFNYNGAEAVAMTFHHVIISECHYKLEFVGGAVQVSSIA